MGKRGTFKNPISLGDVFGRLTVIEGPIFEARNGITVTHFYKCRCECGNDHWVCHGNLRNGSTESCGCYQSERRGKTLKLHGESGKNATSEWIAWSSMKARCSNPKGTDYKSYGGRGIAVCERWENSYINFLEDMGRKPSPRHSLERNDVDGHYSPGNCKWATPEEQAANKQNSIRITMNGETLGIAEWSRRTGLTESVIRRRKSRGWSEERILTTPLFPTGNRIYNTA